MKQLIIIGGGPAGISASIYAARKKIDFLLITKDVGGQVIKAGNIENYLGYAMVDGIIFVERIMEHMRRMEVEPIIDEVVDVKKVNGSFEVSTASGLTYLTKTILFCTGAEHRRLNVPGEREYTGRGVSYCYTCDAPFFKGKNVAVVGGGNSGFEAVEQLLNYANTIYLLEISHDFKADEILKEKVLKDRRVIPLPRRRVLEAKGDGLFLKSIVVENLETGHIDEIEVEGLFVEIGLEPNTKLAKKLGLLLTNREEIIIDCNNRTSERGIYAAGDCTNIFAKQIITAAGEGAKALLSIYHDLTYGISSWI